MKKKHDIQLCHNETLIHYDDIPSLQVLFNLCSCFKDSREASVVRKTILQAHNPQQALLAWKCPAVLLMASNSV